MNKDATIDNMISQMKKPPPLANITFSAEELYLDATIATMIEERIKTLMLRSPLTELDIKLLDVLLTRHGKY